jgi:hypothetical protein
VSVASVCVWFMHTYCTYPLTWGSPWRPTGSSEHCPRAVEYPHEKHSHSHKSVYWPHEKHSHSNESVYHPHEKHMHTRTCNANISLEHSFNPWRQRSHNGSHCMFTSTWYTRICNANISLEHSFNTWRQRSHNGSHCMFTRTWYMYVYTHVCSQVREPTLKAAACRGVMLRTARGKQQHKSGFGCMHRYKNWMLRTSPHTHTYAHRVCALKMKKEIGGMFIVVMCMCMRRDSHVHNATIIRTKKNSEFLLNGEHFSMQVL